MTDKQRRYFFRALWPKACAALGIEGTEEERRAMVAKATGGATNRLSLCDQNQITAVFNYVKALGRPEDVEAARLVANPEVAKAEDEQRRFVFAIRELGFTEIYIQRVADWDCRECGVSAWDRLPVDKGRRESRQPGEKHTPGEPYEPGLRRVLIHLTQRRNDKRREEPREYQMRPARKFIPRAQVNRACRQMEMKTAAEIHSPSDSENHNPF